MAWESMHFAVGMVGGAAIGCTVSLVIRRGWRWTPPAMTLGGLWACVPDMPRLWREDFPWLPFSSVLGSKNLEHWLHSIGDLFFFHKQLDAQPQEFALHGLIGIIVLYNLAILLLLWLKRPAAHPIDAPRKAPPLQACPRCHDATPLHASPSRRDHAPALTE